MRQRTIRKLFFILSMFSIIYFEYTLTFRFSLFSPVTFIYSAFITLVLGILFYFLNRNSLDYYSVQYPDLLKAAFLYSQQDRKKLLRAVRLHDEDYPEKAVKLLHGLNTIAKYDDDYYAVGIMLGLCYSEMKLFDEAVYEFNNLIENGLDDAMLYNYFGTVYVSFKHYDEAFECFRKSVEMESDKPEAYFNQASLFFDLDDVMLAEDYAKKAIEKDEDFYHAISLLAMVCAKRVDKVGAKSHYRQAVLKGEDKKLLKEILKDITKQNKL